MEVQIQSNAAYVPIYKTDKRIIRLQGGAGSGKSIAVAEFILLKTLGQEKHRIFAFRKVARTVKNSIFKTFQDLISDYGLSQFFNINKSDYSITCKITDNEIICGGMDDPEKVKSIKDPTIIWMEEATEFAARDFKQLNLRLRKAGVQNHIILSYNPISNKNWVFSTFVEGIAYRDRELFLKTTYRHNRFLPDEYKLELESLASEDENYYNIYALGEWGTDIKGLIFPKWDEIESFPENISCVYGQDFGYIDPMATIRIGVKEDTLYIDEVFFESSCTVSDMAKDLLAGGELKRNDLIYCDNSPGDIAEMVKSGLRGAKNAKKGPGSINSGIRSMKSYKLKVTARSVNVKKELGLYKWAEDKNGDIIPDKPIDRFNHSLDAIRYGLTTHYARPAGGLKVL